MWCNGVCLRTHARKNLVQKIKHTNQWAGFSGPAHIKRITMNYGALCFNMKVNGQRKERLLSLGFTADELKDKRLIKFSKVFKPETRNKLLELGKQDLLNEVKGVSKKVSRGLRRTITKDLESDNYIEANLLRESLILKYSNLDAKVITLDKIQAKHRVYAFYMNEEVLDKEKFREANPNYQTGQPCVYVGMTGNTIEERYEEHTNPQSKNYKKGSKWMKKHGVRGFSEALAIDLLSHPNISRETLTFGEALQNEKLYAEWLSSKGYGVWWG